VIRSLAMRHVVAMTAGAITAAWSGPAAADKPFVDRPLTLPILHMSADAGIGFGQFQSTSTDAAGIVHPTGMHVGWGSNVDGAVGLPFLGEVGVRFGFRFGQDGVAAGWGAGADHFARLFDPIIESPGRDPFANPEIRLRGSLLDLEVVQLGLETRAVLPIADGSDFVLTPGVPVRIHLPTLARIDTGVWLPIAFTSKTGFTVDIPAQLFFQVGSAFFGPLTGFRYNDPGVGDNNVEVPAGLGGGYTLGGILDLKVQVRTERINDSNWTQYIGGGVGAGLRLP